MYVCHTGSQPILPFQQRLSIRCMANNQPQCVCYFGPSCQLLPVHVCTVVPVLARVPPVCECTNVQINVDLLDFWSQRSWCHVQCTHVMYVCHVDLCMYVCSKVSVCNVCMYVMFENVVCCRTSENYETIRNIDIAVIYTQHLHCIFTTYNNILY